MLSPKQFKELPWNILDQEAWGRPTFEKASTVVSYSYCSKIENKASQLQVQMDQRVKDQMLTYSGHFSELRALLGTGQAEAIVLFAETHKKLPFKILALK